MRKRKLKKTHKKHKKKKTKKKNKKKKNKNKKKKKQTNKRTQDKNETGKNSKCKWVTISTYVMGAGAQKTSTHPRTMKIVVVQIA